jgi:hypothetical protein
MNTDQLDEEQLYYKNKYLKYKNKYLALKKQLYYKNKYLKYKNKYLVFKKQLQGGQPWYGVVSDSWNHATQAVGDTVGHATKAVDNTTKAVGNATDAFIKTFNDETQPQPQPQTQTQPQKLTLLQLLKKKKDDQYDSDVKEREHHQKNNKIMDFLVKLILNKDNKYPLIDDYIKIRYPEQLPDKTDTNYYERLKSLANININTFGRYICDYYEQCKKDNTYCVLINFNLYNEEPLRLNYEPRTGLQYLIDTIIKNIGGLETNHSALKIITTKNSKGIYLTTYLIEQVQKFIKTELKQTELVDYKIPCRVKNSGELPSKSLGEITSSKASNPTSSKASAKSQPLSQIPSKDSGRIPKGDTYRVSTVPSNPTSSKSSVSSRTSSSASNPTSSSASAKSQTLSKIQSQPSVNPNFFVNNTDTYRVRTVPSNADKTKKFFPRNTYYGS